MVENTALILAPFADDTLEALRKDVSVTYESWTSTRRLHSPDELARRINQKKLNILIVEADYLFEEVFCETPTLQFLGVCRNSLDHIDVDSATRHGVCVVNAPGRNANAVAELSIGLMLSLARRIPASVEYVARGGWEDPVGPYMEMKGTELKGKTLGILGLGQVGQAVSVLATAFGMNVSAYDPYVGSPGAKLAGASLEPIEGVLAAADYLSIHTPDNPETRGLLNAERIHQLKNGVYIINTASYWAVDEGALLAGIRSGKIAGLAMDVHRTHPVPPNYPFLGMEQVLLTPHIGGSTTETIRRQSWMMVEDVQRYLRNQKPLRLVNQSVWRAGD